MPLDEPDEAEENPGGEAVEEAPGLQSPKFQPYPTPSQTPPAALLAHSIRRIGSDIIPTPEPLTTINTWQAAFAAGSLAGPIGKANGKVINRAQLQRLLKKGEKPHRSQLPAPPKGHRDLKKHLLGSLFEQAEADHLKSHADIGS